MKNTLRIALLSTLFLTTALADDGQMGSGGRNCPPECTIETPDNCPPGCPGTAVRTAPDSEMNPVVLDAVTRLAKAYFLRA